VLEIFKGIIRTKQEIIYGSKNLALKLYSLNFLFLVKFDTREMKRLYFVSGNVVAFYSNVNIQKAHQIASNHLIDYCGSFRGEFDLDCVECDIAEIYMFREVLSIANNNFLCYFDGKIY